MCAKYQSTSLTLDRQNRIYIRMQHIFSLHIVADKGSQVNNIMGRLKKRSKNSHSTQDLICNFFVHCLITWSANIEL